MQVNKHKHNLSPGTSQANYLFRSNQIGYLLPLLLPHSKSYLKLTL